MNFSDLLIPELYVDKPSYIPGETVKIYISPNPLISTSEKIEIIDFNGEVIGSVQVSINNQGITSDNLFQDGLNYEEYIEYEIPQNMASGIYLINGKYPLVVKSDKEALITIVYPFANNILYYPIDTKTTFSEGVKTASLQRTVPIDEYTEGMRTFFQRINSDYKTNYISDLDLEDIKNFQSKLLIIYGKSSCWTPLMKNALEEYINSGGSVLLMSTYFLNNVCWYNGNTNDITMYKDDSQAMKPWKKYDTVNSTDFGLTYANGGYPVGSNYEIVDKTHPIFNNVIGEDVAVKGSLFISPKVNWEKDIPSVDLKNHDYYKTEILAYNRATYHENKGVNGIFVLQSDSTSGKIVSLGTEDWCLNHNIGKNEDLQLITQNAIDYLLK